jgi:hypothetical protein
MLETKRIISIKTTQQATFLPHIDEFYTPNCAIALLLPYLPKDKIVWEGAWGKGHIARYLQRLGYTVVGTASANFLYADPPRYDILVTNPPYRDKDRFLRRAYALGTPSAMLLPAETLVGIKRRHLFMQYGVQLLVPDRRIQFTTENGEIAIGRYRTVWFCWRLLPQDLVFAQLKPRPRQW